ncbi:MAG: hypothetical protein AB7V27_17310 [Candidatus Binatia bacterium]
MSCAVAADTKLETPEGPLTIKTVGASPTAVMTRSGDGTVRFAMTSEVQMIAAAQPVLRIALENGRSFRVGAAQVLLGPAGAELRADAFQPGDAVLSAFAFPPGYAYRTYEGELVVSDGCVRVARVDNGGTADVYSLRVSRSGCFVFSAGVIGKASQ